MIISQRVQHTNNITNNIAGHNHNNYENNVIKKVNKNIHHISNYGTDANYYNNKSFSKKGYYNFCNDILDFRKNKITSNSQQTGITNNVLETNTQTTNYIENYLNTNNIATVILNTIPSINGNYLWIPETSDNVVPGLGSLITNIQSEQATLTALQDAITNVSNTIQTEIHNLEINNQGDLNVNKELYCHKDYTDYTFQRNITVHKYDNRGIFIIHNHFFTYQRKGNQELQIQFSNNIVADLQNQINNITSGPGGGDPNEPEIGTM